MNDFARLRFLCVLTSTLVACGGPPSVPAWRITVEVSVECAGSAPCAPLNRDNPMFDAAKRADYYDCVPLQADGVVLYAAGEPGLPETREQFQFMHDPAGFRVAPYEAQPDLEELYQVDTRGRLTLGTNRGPAELAQVSDDEVVARYPSGLPGRFVVERHRLTLEGQLQCFQRGEPVPVASNPWPY